MNSPDQSKSVTTSSDQVDEAPLDKPVTDSDTKVASSSAAYRQVSSFDWTAPGVVILISAFFAITARLNAQPATSFVPVVVLSATGCGLLITAIRKLRTIKGAGLLEATLSGFFMALFQFIVAITYQGVFDSLSLGQILRDDFLITWGLVALFSITFSIAGAALGHLVFAPLQQPLRSVFSYLFTILLLGLAPTVVAYLFSAAFDFTLGFNQFIPGPYPTLRLLSSLLPWQIPLPIDLNSNISNIIIFSLLWRIPLFLGNPAPFDLQALEPYIFNGAALALLILSMYRQNSSTAYKSSASGWMIYLFLEAAIGLVIVLPANLWVMRGLQGVLQFHEIVIPIRTLSILDSLTFSLNLITGPIVCISVGIVLRRFLGRRKA
jgi:hypothetical protein